MSRRPMVGLADVLRCVAAGIPLERAAEVCGYEPKKAPEEPKSIVNDIKCFDGTGTEVFKGNSGMLRIASITPVGSEMFTLEGVFKVVSKHENVVTLRRIDEADHWAPQKTQFYEWLCGQALLKKTTEYETNGYSERWHNLAALYKQLAELTGYMDSGISEAKEVFDSAWKLALKYCEKQSGVPFPDTPGLKKFLMAEFLKYPNTQTRKQE